MNTLIKFTYLAFVISVAFVAYLKPYHNWDMLGYMACAVSIDEHNIDSIHSITYRYAKEELPTGDYEALISANNTYRKNNFDEAGYFNDQLSLYTIKPLYILLIYLFYKSGISLTAATVLPSVLAYMGMALLLFFWMMKFISTPRAFIFSVLIMLSPPFWETALSSTPDALCGLLTFSAFFLIVEKTNLLTGIFLLVLSIAVRVDSIFLTIMTLAFLRFTQTEAKRISTTTFLLVSGISVLLFCAISFGLGHFTGSTFKYYTIIQSDFARKSADNPIYQYFILLFKGIYSSQYSVVFLFLFLTFITLLIRNRFLPLQSDFAAQVVLLLLLNILLRYILHPTIEDRFLIAHYLVIAVIFTRTIFEKNFTVPVSANA